MLPVVLMVLILVLFILLGGLGDLMGADLGFSDHFDLELNNGFRWEAIDTTTVAEIFDGSGLGPGESPAPGASNICIDNVDRLQESGEWLAGHNLRVDENQEPEGWFLINTRSHVRMDAKDAADLAVKGIAMGLNVHLEPNPSFYAVHRFKWLDLLKIILWGTPLLIIPTVVFRYFVILWNRTEIQTLGQAEAD